MLRRSVLACLVALASTAHADPRPAPPPPLPACAADPHLDQPDTERPRRKGPSPREYLGLTAATLRERFGAPGCASLAKWRYWTPDGCSYEKHAVTLWFAHGKVSRVNVVHIWTGEECMFDE
jgi:hypothetical protein